MPALLTSASDILCPHGGTVQAVTSDARVSFAGAPALRASDTFLVAGCPFALPNGPHPCVEVQWVQPAARSKAGGDFTLTEASIGLCIAPDQAVQGVAMIVATQPRVSGL